MDDIVDLNYKKALIRKQACFSNLTDKEVENLAELLIEKNYLPDNVIVTEGDPVDSIFLIVNGLADVRNMIIVNNTLQTKSVATLSAGESIGLNDTGFYSLSGKRTATVVAKTNMVLLFLSLAEFHGFSLANPHVNEIMRKNSEAHLAQLGQADDLFS